MPAANPFRQLLPVYVGLALALFAFPGGVREWLEERNASGWLAAPLVVVAQIEAVSAAAGVKPLGERLRAQFAAAIGGTEP